MPWKSNISIGTCVCTVRCVQENRLHTQFDKNNFNNHVHNKTLTPKNVIIIYPIYCNNEIQYRITYQINDSLQTHPISMCLKTD